MRWAMMLPKLWRKGALCWVATVILLGLCGGAWALTEQEIDQRVLEISDQLRCPTCQAISVRDSEAAFSRQIRDKVRAMVMEGQSEPAIKEYFVARYGEWILRAPKREGLGLVLWGLPIAALAVAGGWIGWRLYRNQSAASAGAEDSGAVAAVETEISPEQAERIARDLRRYEEG